MRNQEYARWEQRYAAKLRTARDAIADIRPGQRVYVGSNAGEPQTLVEIARARGVRGFTGDVAESDQSVLRLFHNCGYHVEGDARAGYARLTALFQKREPRTKAVPAPAAPPRR